MAVHSGCAIDHWGPAGNKREARNGDVILSSGPVIGTHIHPTRPDQANCATFSNLAS